MIHTELFNRIIEQLQLELTHVEITRVEGGLMHQMFKVKQASHTFAIKLLNPKIMKRPDALQNFRAAEQLECIIEKTNLPVITALSFDGSKMQQVGNQYYYVYNWFEGKSLQKDEITIKHCQTIAKILARFHNIDKRKIKHNKEEILIDWTLYLAMAKEKNMIIYQELQKLMPLLYQLQVKGNKAIKALPAISVIGHNDMDSKNVLWNTKNCGIIDLECLGYTNPYLELFELALSWSGAESYDININLFKSFIHAYFKDCELPVIDWKVIYDSNYSRLEWLEYNLKRALFIDCNNLEESNLGFDQGLKTLKYLEYYNTIQSQILSCLASQ